MTDLRSILILATAAFFVGVTVSAEAQTVRKVSPRSVVQTRTADKCAEHLTVDTSSIDEGIIGVNGELVNVGKRRVIIINSQPGSGTEKMGISIENRPADPTAQRGIIINSKPSDGTEKMGAVIENRPADGVAQRGIIINSKPVDFSEKGIIIIDSKSGGGEEKGIIIVDGAPSPVCKQ